MKLLYMVQIIFFTNALNKQDMNQVVIVNDGTILEPINYIKYNTT